MSEEAAPPAVRPRRRWWRWLAGGILGIVALLAAALAILDTSIGHRWVADQIAGLRPSNGLRYSVGRIEGSLFSRARLVDVRISDPKGLIFYAPRADLSWVPFAWLDNRLHIRSLVIPRATLAKLPQTIRTGKAGPLLPGFDIRIGELRVDRLAVAPKITGVARTGRLAGRADIHAGRALVDLSATVEGSDTLALKLDAEPDRNKFDVGVHARGTASGVLAKLAGFARPIAIDIAGDGTWTLWKGMARADVGPVRLVDLALNNRSGTYALTGTLTPAPLAKGKLQRLTAPRVAVTGAATLADRRLDGTLTLRSAALAIDTVGTVDLGQGAYRNLRLHARLLQPKALFPNMSGRGIELRAILDGAFATAHFDYRLKADRFAFDDTGFEVARAGGAGTFSKSPIRVPIRFTAARVTGIGDVAGGILRNLSLDGVLRVTSKLVIGDDLRVRSDKLTGRINLTLDLVTGKFEVGVNGVLGRYLIPGLGIVDVRSILRVVPGPAGRGARVIGTGTAQMVRLDNAFFRSLTDGLPKITTGLERTPDGILHLNNLRSEEHTSELQSRL